ncbi:hypothetical protein X975_12459, partial [Stegodyphus mimosarum]
DRRPVRFLRCFHTRNLLVQSLKHLKNFHNQNKAYVSPRSAQHLFLYAFLRTMYLVNSRAHIIRFEAN